MGGTMRLEIHGRPKDAMERLLWRIVLFYQVSSCLGKLR
jgi:hypothetical protein